MNRRVTFFAGAAVICIALIPLMDPKFHWVPKIVGGVYAVLALLALLDGLGRRNL